MPGSIFYKLHSVWEEVMKYWYFGNFGQYKYNLNKADKYLVEAKTLFEYNQYILALTALQKSDIYFSYIQENLYKGIKEKRNIDDKQSLLKSASAKHIEVLSAIKKQLPEQFIWEAEKENAKILNLWESLGQSIKIREKYL